MSKVWTPRSYQTAMREFVLSMFGQGAHGVNLFAGVGVGKTSAALSIADAMLLCGYCRRVLVVAPKKVCTDAWPQEIREWTDFHHLRYALATGGKKERFAAICSQAPIVIVNYDVLPAFVHECGDNWPFDFVIADESTRLKSHRVSQQTSKTGKVFFRASGGKQASSIGKIAHSRVKYWLNLTGSPAPNGLIDVWAQVWFCDAGRRLGRTFTAFEKRWFQSVPRGERLELVPLEFAQEQIQGAIRDLCLTIEAKDYFDLPPLVESVVEVELPPAALTIYKKFEKEMFAEIAGVGVEAFNAAAMTMKCIAEGTLTLTQRGWVPIETVAANDLVWDGDDWVSHDGLIDQGFKNTVLCLGVWMTSDHKVLTTSGWKTAQEVLDGKCGKEYVRRGVRIPRGYSSERIEAYQEQHDSTGDVVVPMRLREGNSDARQLSPQRETSSPEVVRLQEGGRVGSYTRYARDDKSPNNSHVERYAATLPQRILKGLQELRSKGYSCMRPLVDLIRGILRGHATDLAAGVVAGTYRQSRGLLTGELPLGNPYRTGAKQASESNCRHAGWPDGSRTSSGTFQSESCGAVPTDSQGRYGCRVVRTYDLKNAGSKFRFTVLGDNDIPLIVHNCRQIANGAVYYDDEANWQPVHDAKLEALRECVLDANGMPVLVAYQFKTDVERIRKAFPKAVHINDHADTVKDWNAGSIPMLLGHPAGMGHGLSLQHGSNYMVDYATGFNLEHDEQVIGRLGPTRQAQSGYNRAVYRRRLIAKGTIEEYCLKRIKTKDSIQQMLRDAMKGEVCEF